MPRGTRIATASCLIALAACMANGKPATSADQPVPPTSAPAGSQPDGGSNAATSPPPTAIVDRGREALRAAGLSPDLKLLGSEAVQWNDSSLGCPRPGMMYAQVITAGYVLRFAGKGTTHEVHVAGDSALVCSPQLGGGVPKRSTTAYRASDLDAIIETARADLAARLKLQPEEVQLRNFESTTWPDSRLGCGEPQADSETPGPVRGFKLNFTTSRQYYSYHTDLKRAFPCPPIAAE
jgi:hypothetical protein